MNIIEKIKSTFDGSGLTVHYGTPEQLNADLEYAAYPCVFFYLLDTGSVNIQTAQTVERFEVAFYFANLTEFDFNTDENEELIETCKQSALLWLNTLQRSSVLQLISVGRSQRVYDVFDVNLTGFALSVTIEEMQGFSGCDITPVPVCPPIYSYLDLIKRINYGITLEPKI